MKLLLVEDEVQLARVLRAALAKHDVVVDHVASMAQARQAVTEWDHDAVVLDRRLPDGDGLSLIATIRQHSPGMPVIVLTARDTVVDRVQGLDEGADDYLTKPFAVEELLARLRAVRRRPAQLAAAVVRAGRLVFDLSHSEARVADQPLVLQRREALVLEALMRRKGRTVRRAALEEAVYGFDDAIQSNALEGHISRLRRRLAEAEAGVEIHTIRGVGYLLKAGGLKASASQAER